MEIPKLLRDAFRMSIPDIEKEVHKILIEEEWVKAENENETKIEILAAVARIYSSAIWILKISDIGKEVHKVLIDEE